MRQFHLSLCPFHGMGVSKDNSLFYSLDLVIIIVL